MEDDTPTDSAIELGHWFDLKFNNETKREKSWIFNQRSTRLTMTFMTDLTLWSKSKDQFCSFVCVKHLKHGCFIKIIEKESTWMILRAWFMQNLLKWIQNVLKVRNPCFLAQGYKQRGLPGKLEKSPHFWKLIAPRVFDRFEWIQFWLIVERLMPFFRVTGMPSSNSINTRLS